MAKGKEIAKRNSVSALDVIEQELNDEASGFNPTPVVIEILHQQGMFSFPSLPPVKRLVGVILASRMVRVFFPRMGVEEDTKKLLEITGNRPFCSSQDYIHGNVTDVESDNEIFSIIKDKISEGAGDCFKCPLNQWGSVDILGRPGNGKACAELRRLLFWNPGMEVPAILPVPTSSIRAWDGYCSALGTVGMKHNRVVTEVNAEVREAAPLKWSVLTFAKAGDMTEEMAEELISDVVFRGAKQPLVKALVDLFTGREMTTEDYPTNGVGGDEL